jgi:predicted amidohydrolase
MPIAYATYGNDDYRVAIWDLPLQARAFDNGVFVVAANRVGDELDRLATALDRLSRARGGPQRARERPRCALSLVGRRWLARDKVDRLSPGTKSEWRRYSSERASGSQPVPPIRVPPAGCSAPTSRSPDGSIIGWVGASLAIARGRVAHEGGRSHCPDRG